MSGGSKQQPVPTQTTTSNPPPQATELVNLAMPSLRQFAAQPLQPYSGPTVAGFTAPQQQGQQMALDAAGAQAATAQRGTDTAGFYLGGDIWNPASNPNLQGAIRAATDPLYERLSEQLLPQIRSDAITTGGFGGSRQGIAEGQAIRGTQKQAADTGAQIAQDQYKTNVQAQLAALGLLPTVQQAQVQPAITTSGVGDVQQNLAQQQLNAQAQNYWLSQYLPLLQGRELASIAGAIPGGSTTAVGSVPQAQKPGVQQALGGAMAGASLGSAILPGIGTGVGAGAGALLPFLFA